jgi:hypothetical protein
LFYYICIKIKQYYFFLEINKYIPVDIERKNKPLKILDDEGELLLSSGVSVFIKVSFVINKADFLSFAD